MQKGEGNNPSKVTKMEWTPNEKQNKVIAFLKTNKGAFTLAEIGEKIGCEIKSGTTNSLVKKGLIKCNKNAVERSFRLLRTEDRVSTYEIKQQVLKRYALNKKIVDYSIQKQYNNIRKREIKLWN